MIIPPEAIPPLNFCKCLSAPFSSHITTPQLDLVDLITEEIWLHIFSMVAEPTRTARVCRTWRRISISVYPELLKRYALYPSLVTSYGPFEVNEAEKIGDLDPYLNRVKTLVLRVHVEALKIKFQCPYCDRAFKPKLSSLMCDPSILNGICQALGLSTVNLLSFCKQVTTYLNQISHKNHPFITNLSADNPHCYASCVRWIEQLDLRTTLQGFAFKELSLVPPQIRLFPNFETLLFFDCTFTTLPKEFGKLTKLHTLGLYKTPLSEDCARYIFRNLFLLKTVFIAQNHPLVPLLQQDFPNLKLEFTHRIVNP